MAICAGGDKMYRALEDDEVTKVAAAHRRKRLGSYNATLEGEEQEKGATRRP